MSSKVWSMRGDFASVAWRVLGAVGLPVAALACSGEAAGAGEDLEGANAPVGDACAGTWGARQETGVACGITKVDDYLVIADGGAALYAACVEGLSCPEQLCLDTVDYQPISDGTLTQAFDALKECEPACTADGQRGIHVVYTLSGACIGRRPEGLCDVAGVWALSAAGAWFAEAARLEAASVSAFVRLGRELAAHGAPAELVAAAQRAAREEATHARAMRALARRYGGCAGIPHAAAQSVRSLEEMALENAREGCILEGFGALVGAVQAQSSKDPVVRLTMQAIARDEAGHADLAWRVHAWARSQLDASANERLDEVQRSTLASLATQLTVPVARELKDTVGLPDAATQRRILDAYVADLAVA
jgi:hypothetical protein